MCHYLYKFRLSIDKITNHKILDPKLSNIKKHKLKHTLSFEVLIKVKTIPKFFFSI